MSVNGFAQHLHGFLIFSRKKQGLPQNAVFGRSGGIDGDGSLQLANGRWVVALGHVGAGQAVVTALPLRTLTVEIGEFRDGAVEVFLVAKGISQVVADAGFVRFEALGGSDIPAIASSSLP